MVGIFATLASLRALYNSWSTNRDEEARRMLPCVHGVDGARAAPAICPACVAERRRAEREREQRDEAERQRQAAERARQHAELIRKIRFPEYLREMDPRGFEELVCRLFERMGYQVERTPYVGDGGVDAYIEKDGKRYIAQCKRTKGSVGEPVLRDLYGTLHAKGAFGAFVVTTGAVSPQAKAWAAGKPITLVELPELQEMLLRYFAESDIVPADFSPKGPKERSCPLCGARLRVVNGRNGRFLGCTSYPGCRYTSNLRRSRRR